MGTWRSSAWRYWREKCARDQKRRMAGVERVRQHIINVTNRSTDPALSDIYLLAMLLFSLYNPQSPLPNLSSQPTPSLAGAIPKTLFPLWKRMINPNPRTRLPTTSFVAEATTAGFWSQNPLANLVDGLDGFELRSEGDKLSLLRTIQDSSTSIPQPFLLYKVLPSLLHSLSLPTAPSSAMLPLVLSLGKLVPEKEYGKLVLDPVVKLYTSPDRGTRMALLDGLPEYSDRMDQRTVQERVWPNLVSLIPTSSANLRSLDSPIPSQSYEKQQSKPSFLWRPS
jgi:SCY1-like protein 1